MYFSIFKLKETRYMQYVAAITATISIASTATWITWPSPSLPLLMSDNSPIGRPLTSEESSWLVSSLLVGCLPGSILSAWLVEKVGRKGSLMIAAPFLCFPWIIIAFVPNVIVICVARFVGGIGLTIATVVCAMYNGEIAEKDIRGKLGSFLIILKLFGSFFILTVGPFISYTALALSCGAFPVLYAVILYFMPESPVYLIKVGKIEEARLSLKMLSSSNVDNAFLDKQLKEMKNTVDNDMLSKGTVKEFFLKAEYRKPLILMLGIKTLQHLSGSAAIDAYMQSIVEASGSSISPQLSSIIFGAIQIPAVLLAAFVVDRMGRKPLLIISALGCGVALAAEGTYFYLQDEANADVSALGWLPTTGIVIYLLMNPMGIVTLPYVLLGEIYPTNIKGIAVSFAIFYGGVGAFVVSKFFEPISDAFGTHVSFWIFSGFCVLGSIFVMVMLPETKGKTFAEIQVLMNKKY